MFLSICGCLLLLKIFITSSSRKEIEEAISVFFNGSQSAVQKRAWNSITQRVRTHGMECLNFRFKVLVFSANNDYFLVMVFQNYTYQILLMFRGKTIEPILANL